MKYLFLLLSTIVLFSCQNTKQEEIKKESQSVQKNENQTEKKKPKQNQPKACNNEKIAYDFLNDYISIINQKSFEEIQDWITTNPNVSSDYVKRYKEIFANNEYIEADPVLFSQDYPQKFIVKETQGEYVGLTGKDWGDHTWFVRVKDCKVIGSGIINIPQKIYSRGIKMLSSEEKINEIRAVYNKINKNLASYRVTEFDNDESTEGGTSKFYIHNNQFVKITKEYLGEMGKRNIDYYFTENGELRFVFEQLTHYNAPMYVTEDTEDGMEAFDPKKSTVEENRYYFYNDELIRWLLPTGEIADYSQLKINKKAEELLEINERHQ